MAADHGFSLSGELVIKRLPAYHWPQTKITIRSKGFTKENKPQQILWLPGGVIPGRYFSVRSGWSSGCFRFCSHRAGHPRIPDRTLSWQVTGEPPLDSMWPLSFFFWITILGHLMGIFLKPIKGNKDGPFCLLNPISVLRSFLSLGEWCPNVRGKMLPLVAHSGRYNAFRGPLVQGPFS